MITVHHLQDSRSQRILWLLEELGMAYEVQRSERDPATLLGPNAQKQVHALGKWPVIEHEGLTLAESGAIVEYLTALSGNAEWRPGPDSAAFTDYLYWLHFAEASLQPNLFLMLVFRRLPAQAPGLVRPIVGKVSEKVMSAFLRPRITDQLAEIDRHLATREWFAGERLTGADVMMSFPLEAALARVPGAGQYLNIVRYVKGIQSRPAYQRSLTRGGEYTYLYPG